MQLRREIFIEDTSIESVFAFFSDPKNLAKITPASLGFRIISAPDRSLRAGDRIEYRIHLAGIPIRWVTLITDWKELDTFVDSQEKGPYKKWIHRHTFIEKDGGVHMQDQVDYELPLGLAGRLVAGWIVRRQVESIFDYRNAVIGRFFDKRAA